jgi:hypothetical protein
VRALTGRMLRVLGIVRIETDEEIPRWRQFLLAAAVGAIGSTIAGIAVPAPAVDSSGQMARILIWLALGVAAGLESPSAAGLAGVAVGTFVAYLPWELRYSLTFNYLWVDLLINAFGLPFILAPGWAIGMYLDGRRRRPAPEAHPWQPWDVTALHAPEEASTSDRQSADGGSIGSSGAAPP